MCTKWARIQGDSILNQCPFEYGISLKMKILLNSSRGTNIYEKKTPKIVTLQMPKVCTQIDQKEIYFYKTVPIPVACSTVSVS